MLRHIGLVITMTFGLITNVNAQTGRCDSILRYGVFEDHNTLDIRSTYNMLKTENCGSSSVSGNVVAEGLPVGLGAKEDFCKKSEQEAISFLLASNKSRTVSQTLATAWSDCQKNYTGFTEKITVSPQAPENIRYRVTFRSDLTGVHPKVTSFGLTNLKSCTIPVNTEIGPGGETIDCTRINVCQPASITLRTTNGSPFNLAASEIPAPAPTLQTRVLSENDRGPQGGNVRVLGHECTITCDGEVPSSNAPNGDCPSLPYTTKTSVHFGAWSNNSCQVSGAGWHADNLGSCGRRQYLTKRCSQVEVTYLKGYGSCSIQ